MSKIKYILGYLTIVVMLAACEDSYERSPGGEQTAVNPVLNTLTENAFTLDDPIEGDDGDFLFRVSWSRPRISYTNGLPVDVQNMNYTIEAGILSQNYQNKVEVVTTEDLFTDIFSSQLYKIAENLGGEEFNESLNIELRIVANYEGNTDTLISNSIPVVVSRIAQWEPAELTIKFKQAAGSWEEFAVYAWGDSEVYGGWPGETLEADANGWYSFNVPTHRPINLIINDNGNGQQFDFLADPTEDACYEFDTDNASFTAVDCN